MHRPCSLAVNRTPRSYPRCFSAEAQQLDLTHMPRTKFVPFLLRRPPTKIRRFKKMHFYLTAPTTHLSSLTATRSESSGPSNLRLDGQPLPALGQFHPQRPRFFFAILRCAGFSERAVFDFSLPRRGRGRESWLSLRSNQKNKGSTRATITQAGHPCCTSVRCCVSGLPLPASIGLFLFIRPCSLPLYSSTKKKKITANSSEKPAAPRALSQRRRRRARCMCALGAHSRGKLVCTRLAAAAVPRADLSGLALFSLSFSFPPPEFCYCAQDGLPPDQPSAPFFSRIIDFLSKIQIKRASERLSLDLFRLVTWASVFDLFLLAGTRAACCCCARADMMSSPARRALQPG